MSLSVKVIGPVFEKSERATLTREIAFNLAELGITVLLNPLDKPVDDVRGYLDAETLSKIDIFTKTQIPGKFVSFFTTPIESTLMTDNDAVANIPWVYSEFDRLPYVHTLVLNTYPSEEIWVPTEAQKDIFVKSGVRKRVVVVPFGIDTKRFSGELGTIEGLRKDGAYYFGMHSNLDPTSGFDIALSAFYDQFKDDDNAYLIWKTHIVGGKSEDRKNAINQILSQLKGDSKAHVLAITDDKDEVFDASLINTIDCYLAPTRIGGWGVNILRAMASGKPVICNINTGNKSYTNHQNSIPATSSADKIQDLKWVMSHPIYQDMIWYNISKEELMKKMKEAKEDDLSDISKKAKADVQKLAWDKSLLSVFKELKKFES